MQLPAKEWALTTRKLTPGGLFDSVFDRPDMTSIVHCKRTTAIGQRVYDEDKRWVGIARYL